LESGVSLDTSVAASHEEFEDCMGREAKIAFDEPLPGELVLTVLFALFLVLVVSLLLG
jgi:hypothetical protein